jgi:3-methyladenine DNA glycosylase AlkC
LKFDVEHSVRKSVANSLNDISKNHPEVVIDLCKEWMKECKHDNENQMHANIEKITRAQYVIRRGCR